MNRSDLIAAIVGRTGPPTATVDAVLTGFASVLVEAVAAGTRIHLPGLLTMETVVRPARQGRNPATGQPMQIAGKRLPKITAGATLKRAASGE